ncbi:2,4-dihydroxyhept-2-ene-1,7-dioic acid aldolase [Roseibacterium elongatum DSM 19469]|uniref:Hydroxypyruvate/pyruvate aldolase n=1 Tax=Roseicyclus elongatus DSM 19469 TaxID=1294273 RepID=W8S8G1_9RHOB|nr:aldolase/citrate lyase family protein [Roseibacterium elongatum]AHM05261.1 2,4-dihydroxyhept-2-ene-1,7-dioic acid aldolase [Roseibacterium elongatum DSM 19469]
MPAPRNDVKAALAAGQLQRGLWLNLDSPVTAEIAGRAGFDWCLIDGEHGPWDPTGIRAQLIALEGTGTTAVLRVPVAQDWILKQALDLGVQTVLVPMVDSVAEAEAVVRACRYPPEGVRGMGAAVARAAAYGNTADYAATANEEICILVQAESRAAMADLAAIAAVDGVDGVFIGPADLGADMGYRDALDAPELWDEVERGIAIIRDAGKAAGIIVFGEEAEARMIDCGVTFLGVGSDAALLAAALKKVAAPA